MQMVLFNQLHSIVRKTLNIKAKKGTQIIFNNGGSCTGMRIRNMTVTIKGKEEVNIETAEMKFLRSVAGHMKEINQEM
jgi:hypothetical protein